jgi:hypothetical protein
MESTNSGSAEFFFERICPLEWVTAAMDAAWRVAEREDTGRFRLDYSHFYTEKLAGL